MDFDLDETQRELQQLTEDVLAREPAASRGAAPEPPGEKWDRGLWKALAQAGVLGAGLPAPAGGAGLGPVELTVVLRRVGAHAATVPAYATLALAAPVIARHGSPDQIAALAPVAEGETVLTAAVREPAAGQAPGQVSATARRDGGGYVLDGVKTFVPYAAEASYALVPARTTDAGIGVFLIDPAAAQLTEQPSASGEPAYRIDLAGVRAAGVLGDCDGTAWRTLRRCAALGAVAMLSGVIEGALRLTTGYVQTREQFGRPLAGFQAVTMQLADVYIAARTMDVALWAAAWRLAERPPGGRDGDDLDELLAIAAHHACDPVQRALYTCQHLHGGIGVDITYPLHRYFGSGRQYGQLLGGGDAALAELGDLLAAGEGA